MTASASFDLTTIAQRLTTVEQEVAELKRHDQKSTFQPWYLQHAGKFADDPEFQEILRLGKEIRAADRPG